MFCHDFALGGGDAMVAMFTLSLAAQVSCNDMFASKWFANYDMFTSGSTRLARLANKRYACKHVVGKDIIC
jgi:hypothetical protein